MKKVVYDIEFCNSSCPHFYHNYEDFENVWCELLDAKVHEAGECDLIWNDYKKRPIPKECPLENSN